MRINVMSNNYLVGDLVDIKIERDLLSIDHLNGKMFFDQRSSSSSVLASTHALHKFVRPPARLLACMPACALAHSVARTLTFSIARPFARPGACSRARLCAFPLVRSFAGSLARLHE